MKLRKISCSFILLFCIFLLVVSLVFAFTGCTGRNDEPMNSEAEYYISLASDSWQVFNSKESIPENLHFQPEGENEYKLTIQLDEGEQFTVNKLNSEEKIGYENIFSTADDLTNGDNGSIRVAHSGTFVLFYNEDEKILSYSYFAPSAVPVSGVELDHKELTLELNAQATLTATVEPQNAENKIVSYSTSNDSVVSVTNQGVVTAVGYGTAVITVTTAQNGCTDYCNVTVVKHVVSMRFASEEMTLVKDGEEKDLSLVFSPSDATEEYKEVDIEVTGEQDVVAIEKSNNGYKLKGLDVGTVTITATLKENPDITASCQVEVLEAGTVLASIEKDVRVMINASVTLNAKLENGSIESVDWSVENSAVATVSGDGITATVSGVDFGSTVVTAEIHTQDGSTYNATCNVLVADEWYFIYGYGLGKSDWDYVDYISDKNAAQLDELLLTEESKGIYILKRHFTPDNGFQIIFPKVGSFTQADESGENIWSKNIPSHWVESSHYYRAGKSSSKYISNSTEYFCVNTAGVYTVTLDLTGASAAVYIKMESLDVTGVQLDLTNGNYILSNGDEATVSFAVSPAEAYYYITETDVEYSLTSDYADFNKYLSCSLDTDNNTLTLSAGESPKSFTAVLHLSVRGVEQTLEFYVLSSSSAKVAVTDIHFEQDKYEFNVNNGAGDWTTTVKAFVNDTATNKQVRYYDVTDYDELLSHSLDERAIVDPVTGKVTARSLGTLKIMAVSLDAPKIKTTVEVLFYSDQIYIVGDQFGWTAQQQGVTSTSGTKNANYTFTQVSTSKYTFTFPENDIHIDTSAAKGKFKIVFLGIDSAWTGEINSTNIVRELCNVNFGWNDGDVENSGTNIVFVERAPYTLTLDLSMHKPVLLISRTDRDVAEDYVLDFDGDTELKLNDTATMRIFKVPNESFDEESITISYQGNEEGDQAYLDKSYDATTNTLTFTVKNRDHKEDKSVTVSITVGNTTNELTFTILAEHHLVLTWDDTDHWYMCTDEDCNYYEDSQGNANQKTKHTQTTTYSADAEGHYYACTECGAKLSTVTPHKYSLNNGVFDFSSAMNECEECHYQLFKIDGNKLVEYHGNAETVQIPNNVTIIGDHAFEGHAELKTLTYSDNLTSIGAYAFAGCTNLTAVTIGSRVSSIGQHAFDGTAAKITWGGGFSMKKFGTETFYGYLGSTITIPSSINTIGTACFAYSNLVSIEIPDTVTSFDGMLFQGCNKLRTAIFGQNTTILSGFDGCIALEKVLIKGTKFYEFGISAFKGCNAIKGVYICRPLTEILTCNWLIQAVRNNDNDVLKGKIFVYSETNPGSDPCGEAWSDIFGYFRDWIGGTWHWDDSTWQNLSHIVMWGDEETAAVSYEMPAIVNDRKYLFE